MQFKKIKVIFPLLAGLFLFSSCMTLPASYGQNPAFQDHSSTTTALNSVSRQLPPPAFLVIKSYSPRSPYSIVKVNLAGEGLTIISNFSQKNISKSFSPKTFAKKSASRLVINTTPFKKDGSPAGLVIENGNLISQPNKKYAALAIYKEESGYRARIFDSQEEIDLSDSSLYLAAGGFWTILRDEKIYDFVDHKDYRSAAGLADGGKTLFLMCGKKLSYMDCAEILKEAGAENAMEFDGGRSAQLVIKGKNVIAGPRRKVAAVLGFK